MPTERGRRLLYVYALTDARGGSGHRVRKSSNESADALRTTADGRLEAGARSLRVIDIGAVGAIAESVDAAPDASEATLLEQHAIVVRLARRFDALLPVRFGAVFTRGELTARIESSHDVVRRALDRVRGRVQMTVRLHGTAPEPVPRDASGTAWLAARAARARLLKSNAARLRRPVARLVDDERIDPGKGNLQGTVYHLISAVNVERYRSAMADVAPALAPARVTLTGPWPVFAFVPELDRASGGSHAR